MSNTTNTGVYFSVVTGRSETVSVGTLEEARDFATAQRDYGRTVRVFFVAEGQDVIEV